MIYIGGYKAAANQGIYLLDDELNMVRQISCDDNTSYFDVCKDRIYTIIKRADKSGIAVFDLDGNEKVVYLSNEKPACFIEKHDKRIYAAYYHDALVKVFDEQLHLLHEFHYPSGSKCHQVIFFKEMLAVVLLGLDKILFYDQAYHFLFEMQFPKNSGPRHGVHTADEKRLYVLSELSNELFVIDMTQRKIIQCLSVKKDDRETIAAAIRLSKDEKHLYTSTRGQDLIKHFIVEKQLKEMQCVHLEGQFPRDFKLLDNALVVGYQKSPLVQKYSLNDEMNLKEVTAQAGFDKIVCIK